MRRFLVFSLVTFVLIASLLGAAAIAGYYAHKLRFEPVYALTERVELKLRRTLGFKSDTEVAVERIETIFFNMRGRVHVMPERDFKNGGALSVWGDDLLVMHKSGIVFWIDRDQEEGMVLSGLRLPENGAAGYIKLAAEKYPGRSTRADAMRFNDIEYVDAPGQRGLLLSYTFVDTAQECYHSRLAWLPLPETVRSIREATSTPEDWEIVYDTTPCLGFNKTRELMLAYMAGGRLGFKAPNLVYWGVGEYHLDGIYRPDAGIQSDDSDYGKVLEINLDTRTARHYSKGHRNVQGTTLDADGRVWTTEHGMRGGDELNLIRDGANYGWPIVDMGTLYNGVAQDSPSGPGRHTDFTAPVYAWVPSTAVSSLALVNNFHPAWDKDILIGSLKERTLYRARIHDDRLVSMEPIRIGQRIRDVMQWGNDRIALWLDLNEVVILEIEQRNDPLEGLVDDLLADGMSAELAEAAVATLEGCNECHSYEADIHGAGPSLAGVTQRPVAGSAFPTYSDALRSLGGNWSEEKLAAYIAAPEDVAEGTSMTGFGVGDAELATAIAKALAKVKLIRTIE